MNYYEEKDNKSKVAGAIAASIYGVVMVLVFVFVYLPSSEVKPDEVVYIEFVEEEQQQEQTLPPSREESPRHQSHSTEIEQTNQVSGQEQQTTRVNPLPGFAMNSGPDEPEESMDPLAPDSDKERRSGSGSGLNVAGNDALDAGLQGRGVVGSLPQPRYPGNVSGKIVIRVTVGKDGRVTSAEYQQKGSTLSDASLIAEAKAAALRARFRESSAEIMGGEITYKFNLN